MKITLLSVTLTMVLLMDVHADVKPQRNFDVKRFAGRWYRVGLAYNSAAFAQHRNKLAVCMGVVEPKSNGDVVMTVWRTKSSFLCQKEVYKYEKTSVPGVFTYFSTRHGRMKDVTVVETNYSEFALIHKHRKFHREFTQVSLYSRTQKLRPEVIEKFKRYALQHGFPEESIIIPPLTDNCPHARH
ncbi:neutrophil gelatinase-associated lipocalin [Clarias gariepinus]|uniref:prostaglandin D2 synthase a n=1 Tax=Clarias gariepinus TaxID=13013 RepID=UPI00234CD7E3|nr:prostaglandin D2 synthase a [Clarias gariepinus]